MKTVKKILITGGAGYIGNELIKALPESTEIVVVDNFHIDTAHKREVNKKLTENRKVTIVNANVAEVDKYQDLLHDVDCIIYMASLNSYKESNRNPLLYLRENNINLQIFLNALKEYSPNITKVLLTSTRGVYGEGPYLCNDCHSRMYPALNEILHCTECASTNVIAQNLKETDTTNPSSCYGITKKLQEDLIRLYCSERNIPLDIFRIFNVYGENQGNYYSNIGIIPQIYEQIKNTHQMYLSGNGIVARDFIYVGDIVKVMLASIFDKNERKNETEIYNLGSGQSVSIKNLADYFEQCGYQFKRNNKEEINDIKYSVADNTKVSKAFNITHFRDIYEFLDNSYKKS